MITAEATRSIIPKISVIFIFSLNMSKNRKVVMKGVNAYKLTIIEKLIPEFLVVYIMKKTHI